MLGELQVPTKKHENADKNEDAAVYLRKLTSYLILAGDLCLFDSNYFVEMCSRHNKVVVKLVGLVSIKKVCHDQESLSSSASNEP